MDVIILAAGKGKRFESDIPKILMEINGKSLLHHHIGCLLDIKEVNNIIIITGYKSELIQDEIDRLNQPDNYIKSRITVIKNEEYNTTGNSYSLFLGFQHVNRFEDVIFMDADVWYDELIMKDFIKKSNKTSVLVGKCNINDMEAVKVYKYYDHLSLTKGKIPKKSVLCGEALGIVKISDDYIYGFESILQLNIKSDWEYCLDFLFSCESKDFFDVIPAYNDNWIEIDTKKDHIKAEKIACIPKNKTKLLFLAIDGLTYSYIKQNLDIFDNFKELVMYGSEGSIQFSTVSALDWAVIYSGKTPDMKKIDEIENQRGIFDNQDTKDKVKFNLTGWDIINPKHFIWTKQKSCLVNMYLTKYMPDEYLKNTLDVKIQDDKIILKENGYISEKKMKSYKFSPEEMPKFFENENKKLKNISVKFIDEKLTEYEEFNFPKKVKKQFDSEFKVIKWLVENKGPFDFFHFFTGLIDYVGHFAMFKEEIQLECLKQLDLFVGKVKDYFKFDNIVILSDHGMCPIDCFEEYLDTNKFYMQKTYEETKRSKKYGCLINRGISNKFIISGDHYLPNTMFFYGDSIKHWHTMKNYKKKDYYKINNTLLKLLGYNISKHKTLDVFKWSKN